MIHKFLTLTRSLFLIDCETTGTDPQRDRIVELGFQEWTADGLKSGWRSLVDPGAPIPPSATKVHHIEDAMMKRCRACSRRAEEHPAADPSSVCLEFKPVPRFAQIAAKLARGLSDCDFGGQGVRFDLQLLASEMQRAGVEWSYLGARIVDSTRLEQLAVPRSLSHLYEKYTGNKLHGAHGALNDVVASGTVIARQLEEHLALPRDLDQLHAKQWPGWIDGDGKFRFVDGIACFSNWGKHAGRPMSAIPRDYYDFILGADFSADVKQLAADAKAGKFPTEGKQ